MFGQLLAQHFVHTALWAGAAGIAIVPVTETLPLGLTFQEWQLEQARALATALRK